ncbi:endodeoxyribonuclease [Lacticaseibacillus parakribbianus]|uniref:endodeoxyribonuclease n=1 Tax=Lacticaseibacillus parakribbianus TaxID=2970927 RepID=UPI0021CAFF74|nr:endodeoxyribonuclease [Lacticaseibacillus parakribbianus]
MTLNQYIQSERGSRFGGAKIKKQATATVEMFVQRAMLDGITFEWGHPLAFDWYWYDHRTDPDNIAFQHKFVFDGMMAAGFLDNDNWDRVGAGYTDRFYIDKVNPRVEVYELNKEEQA